MLLSAKCPGIFKHLHLYMLLKSSLLPIPSASGRMFCLPSRMPRTLPTPAITTAPHPQVVRTFIPTKTTKTAVSNSTPRKDSENEAYQMTERNGADRTQIGAAAEEDLATDGPAPAPADCAC